MNGFSRGIAGFGKAFRFMLRHRMGWMFLAPVLLWALFAFALFQAGASLVDAAQAWGAHHLGLSVPVADRSGWAGAWDDVKAFLNGARDVLVWITLKLAIFWLVALISKYVVLAVLSPLLSYASEHTEEILTGTATSFSVQRWAREVLRGLLMALRNGAMELGINILTWAIALFMPLLAPLAALFLWLVSCWFYGFSMFDYIHERRRLGVQASLRTARERRGMVLANGILFNLLMKVPVLGMIAAPLLGAVGAVLAETPPGKPNPPDRSPVPRVMRALLLALALPAALALHAQGAVTCDSTATGHVQVFGNVTDSLTGKPVYACMVEHYDMGGKRWSVSVVNSDGRYALFIPAGKPFELRVTNEDGYRDLRKTAKAVPVGTKQLRMDLRLVPH